DLTRCSSLDVVSLDLSSPRSLRMVISHNRIMVGRHVSKIDVGVLPCLCRRLALTEASLSGLLVPLDLVLGTGLLTESLGLLLAGLDLVDSTIQLGVTDDRTLDLISRSDAALIRVVLSLLGGLGVLGF